MMLTKSGGQPTEPPRELTYQRSQRP